MTLLNYISAICMLLLASVSIQAQEKFKAGTVSGNFKIDAQTYRPDSLIGADSVAENLLSNTYVNVKYKLGDFNTGIRFEGYFNTMLGFDKAYDGFGIANRYASYNTDFFEVTAGSFYEQFGNGLTLRTYEDKDLGYDNSLDGFRLKIKPIAGIVFIGVIGNQRICWEKGESLVRGLDGGFNLNDFIRGFTENKHRIIIGGSFVSKYQKDENPLYILPENVASGGGRLNYTLSKFNLSAEYAFKSQDPSFDNGYIFKTGSALMTNINFTYKNFGLLLQYKWLDNMSFRSERDESANNLLINNLPAISKNHSYSFTAMYPYATQLNGEVGLQTEWFYRFKKESLLGGKYGTLLTINFAQIQNIDKQPLANGTIFQKGSDGYKTRFLSVGNEVFYQDINIEISKKISKKVKTIITYQHLYYNQLVLQGHLDKVVSNTVIADVSWRISPRHNLRMEAEWLGTQTKINADNLSYKQDYGDWVMLLIEYSISPHWFFAISDQYNYISTNNKVALNTLNLNYQQNYLNRNHYYSMAMGYTRAASRIAISYGKQREGILCIGGVCRTVPASNGFLITMSHTF